MKKKNIVTCFLEHNHKILILKGSEKVSTYQGRWAGVSGYIEGDEDSDKRALKEITVETGLSEKDLIFVRKGIPLTIKNGEFQRIVHPYLFRIENPELIKIEREHIEIKWIDYAELSKYQTVPGLKKAFFRVYLSLEIEKRLDEIKNDRGHRADFLSMLAVETLKYAAKISEKNTFDDFFEEIRSVGWHLIDIRPGTASISFVVSEILYKFFNERKKRDRKKFSKESFIKFVEEYIELEKNSLNSLTEFASRVVKDNSKWLTHSYSSTVIEVIKKLKDRNIEIYATESRPLFEGRKTAEILSDYVKVTIITDAKAGYIAKEVDGIIVGADSILQDGSLVNKMGTSLIALAAKEARVPFYTICNTRKFYLKSEYSKIEPEEKDSNEVYEIGDRKVSVKNTYFDITPSFYISGIITEKGIFSASDISKEIKIKEKYLSIFK
ncbi:MAG: NUDIX domain-containing protein [Candidatus Helarchaeota archaeon]|nr:NUDIX domain-containing protein [Candidatus Helarchaeota archaeon]